MNSILHVAAQYNYYRSWIESDGFDVQESYFEIEERGEPMSTSNRPARGLAYLFGRRSGFDEENAPF